MTEVATHDWQYHPHPFKFRRAAGWVCLKCGVATLFKERYEMREGSECSLTPETESAIVDT